MKRMRVAEPMQWGMDGANFRPVGITKPVRKIPAGVYGMRSDMSGWFLQPASIVTDTLIELPSKPISQVLGRVQRFRHARDRYREFGVLYKTGILMYGPAGCGRGNRFAGISE